jgi:cell fate regulator YaaT (PSP1 superfamily)
MGCGSGSCGTTKEGEVAPGCGSKGGCSTGGCNKNNVSDWLADMPLSFNENFNIVEIAFKRGARKGFYRNTTNLDMHKGQLVVVEAAQGFDVGEVSLQGELVKVQMKKSKITERDDTIRNILRIASETDINTFLDGRNKENETMVRARAIAKSQNLQMKVGDIEYQGDGKKLTIYYTADDRVDFRELVRVFARDFKVKIEMRQIGARQEAARIGGMGTCGRELCCSTWLQDFKSVTTQAVRYQNLAINTEKMSGQCGRLKCCLNYELDTYNDALKKFPKNVERIETEEGVATLRKTEILKKLMWFEYEGTHGNPFKLDVETVAELIWMNKSGKKPASLSNYNVVENTVVDESKHDDLVGQVSLATLMEKDRRGRNNKGRSNNNRNANQSDNRDNRSARQENKVGDDKPVQENRNKTQGDRNNQQGNRNQQGGNRNNPQGGNRNNKPQGDRNKPQGDRNRNEGNKPENKGPQTPTPPDNQ